MRQFKKKSFAVDDRIAFDTYYNDKGWGMGRFYNFLRWLVPLSYNFV